MPDHKISTLEADDGSSNSSVLKTKDEVVVTDVTDFAIDPSSEPQTPQLNSVPLKWKIASILMVSAIGFGSNWSSGITGAMKTVIKKEMKINNTQYALLDGSEDFMITILMLLSGLVTDRIGGAGTLPLLFLKSKRESANDNQQAPFFTATSSSPSAPSSSQPPRKSAPTVS